MKYTCPCCGYIMFEEPPGSYDICKICFWEDDSIQLRFPTLVIGANEVSLTEAQRNFQELGTIEERLIQYVRKPTEKDRKDPEWRMIDPLIDRFETPNIHDGLSYFKAVGEDVEDIDTLYYWKK